MRRSRSRVLTSAFHNSPSRLIHSSRADVSALFDGAAHFLYSNPISDGRVWDTVLWSLVPGWTVYHVEVDSRYVRVDEAGFALSLAACATADLDAPRRTPAGPLFLDGTRRVRSGSSLSGNARRPHTRLIRPGGSCAIAAVKGVVYLQNQLPG